MEDLNVLLIDDEEELVSTWIERLSLRDIKACGVTNGMEAIKRVVESDFDAVVLDLKIPGMNGMEIMQKIKSIRPNLPIIMITGHGSLKDEEKGLLGEAYDYLIKPIEIEVLIEKIKEAKGTK